MTRDRSGLPRYFVFIRAINVGKRRLTNDELMAPFVQLGLEDVSAYQAAGNITFRTSDPKMTERDRLEAILADAYGFDPVAFVRTLAELQDITQAHPFTDQQLAGTGGRVQVSFLHEAPSEPKMAQVRSRIPDDDLIAFVDREWFWLPKDGVSDSRLPVSAVENLIGPLTMRTLGTVARMLARFER